MTTADDQSNCVSTDGAVPSAQVCPTLLFSANSLAALGLLSKKIAHKSQDIMYKIRTTGWLINMSV